MALPEQLRVGIICCASLPLPPGLTIELWRVISVALCIIPLFCLLSRHPCNSAYGTLYFLRICARFPCGVGESNISWAGDRTRIEHQLERCRVERNI